MKTKTILPVIAAVLLCACGEGVVKIEPSLYEPKIAVEGFLYPGQPVSDIYITRNFPVDADLTSLNPLLPEAQVSLTDIESGNSFPLSFNPLDLSFHYSGNDLTIQATYSYRLDVQATIEGKEISAHATTTVPQTGLDILGINHEILRYRQKDVAENIIDFLIDFERSPGTTDYIAAVTALEADTSNFIYDNPFEEVDAEDVLDDLANWRFDSEWIQDTPATAGQSTFQLFWFDFWFYSDYQIVLFAADKNYADFLRTYDDVFEDDGNLHAPVFNIEGDGIGIFGSAVTDTVFVRVTQ